MKMVNVRSFLKNSRFVRHSSANGLTLIELMITLIIVGVLLSAGLITLRGYIPKQRLLTTVSGFENIMSRAQSEASARSFWTCIRFDTTADPIKAVLRVDDDSDRICEDPDDQFITEMQFKKDITLAGATGDCLKNISTTCEIWFDNTGSPKLCGNCAGQTVTAPNCIDFDFQIIFVNDNLGAGTKARELEALNGGLIQTVKPGEKGLVTTLWAKIPPNEASGCE